jgi:glycine cleavage system aminomethyltransferase T
MGAHFGSYAGWEVPESFVVPETEAGQVRSGVGLADLSFRSKYETERQPERNWWRLRDDRYLTLGDPPLEAPAGAIDVTSVFADLLLAGPRSRDVLGKLSSLNCSDERLPNLACAQGNVAHIHTIVLREDLGTMPSYHLLVTRDYAESFWEALVHAGHEFSLRPFGTKALEGLRA